MESKKQNEEVSRGSFVEQNNYKKLNLKRVGLSFKFSFEGLKYAYLHEQSLALHLICTAIVIVLNIGFRVSPMTWVITLVMMALILVTELINTSIEAVVDMVTQEFHPLAKIAKDTASAAVFVTVIIAIGMWLFVFVPKIVSLF